MKLIFHILQITQVSWVWVCCVVLLGTVSSFFSIFPYEIIRTLIDSLNGVPLNQFFSLIFSASNSIIGISVELSVFLVILFLVTAILTVISRNIYAYLATKITDEIIRRIRNLTYRKVLNMPYSFFVNNDKGKIQYTTVTDTQNLELVFSQPMYTLFSDLIDIVWVTIFLFYIYPKSIIFLAVGLPLIYCLSIRTGKLQRKIAGKIQEDESSLMSYLRQVLSAIDSIKSLNAQKYEEKKFEETTQKIFNNNIDSAKSLALFFPMEGVVRFLTIFGILLVGVFDYQKGGVTAGTLAIVYFYAVKFYSPVSNINKYYQFLQSGLASAERVKKLLDLKEESCAGKKIESDPGSDFFLEVNDASVLVEKGEKISLGTFKIQGNGLHLIKGESGSGKTSFLKVLLGFSDYEGRIRLNGVELRKYSPQSLRSWFGYCSQFPFVLEADLIQNVNYPDNFVEQEKLRLISKQVGFSDVFLTRDLGEEKISGGEKSRVSFLRTFFSKSGVFLLDEITSSLDEKTEGKIIQFLASLSIPVIAVTHSTHHMFDQSATIIIQLGEIND